MGYGVDVVYGIKVDLNLEIATFSGEGRRRSAQQATRNTLYAKHKSASRSHFYIIIDR